MSTFDIGYLAENDCEEELSIPMETQVKATRKRKSDERVTVKNENTLKTTKPEKKSVYEDLSKTVEYSSIQKDYKFAFNAPQVFIILLMILLIIFIDVSRIRNEIFKINHFIST